MALIVPSLWYAKEAEEAARHYVSIFPDSHIDRVTEMPGDNPIAPDPVRVVEFTLLGQSFLAMSAGPFEFFNHSVSFTVTCDDQAEVDRYWYALLEGGTAEQCGWLKDKYGLSWQIVPDVLPAMMRGSDRRKARRATEAMMKMVKLDIAGLKAAFDGAD